MNTVLKKLLALMMCAALLTGCIPAISEESITEPTAYNSEVTESEPGTAVTETSADSTEAPETESTDSVEPAEMPAIEDATETTTEPSSSPDPESEQDNASAAEETEEVDTAAFTATAVSEIIAEMNADSLSDDLAKAEWLYSKLLAIASHGEGNTAYSALVEGFADSEGYALAYASLLAGAGISAQTVYGAESEAWVIAKLNGSYVHIDAYADDASDVFGKNFGLTDAAMAFKHSWDRNSAPACTDAKLNYYVRHKGYTIVTDAESLHTALTEATGNVKLYNANGLDLQKTAASFSDVEVVIKEEGCYATATVTATGDKASVDEKAEIDVTTTSITLGVGQEKKIEYTVYPAGSTINFYTNASSVCTVSSKGVLTAVKAGSAVITLAINGATAQISVKVVAAPTAISLVSDHYIASDDALYIGYKEEVQLDYKTTPVAAKEIAKVQYSVGSSTYATVTSDGMLTGKKLGSTSVTLTCYNGFNVSKYVKIVAAPSSLAMDTSVLSLGIGETAVSKATIGNDTHGIFSVSYSSNNTNVATVDSNGKITAVGIGETDIVASTYNNLTATRHIKVAAAPEKITITGKYTTVAVGETLQLECSLLPEGCSGVITWTSSSTSYATVTSSGLVTPKKEGSVKITVKAYNGISSTYDIIIKKAVTKAVLNIPTKEIGIDETVQTSCTLTGFTNSYLYNSTSADVATIDANGAVTGKKAGTTKLYLKAGNIISAGVAIEVKPAPTSVTASRHEITVCQNDTLSIGYTLSQGSAGTVTFTTSDASVATVDSNGTITAVGLGAAKIELATYNGLTDSCTVNVVEPPTEITLSASNTTLGVGEKMQLNVGYVPESAVSTVSYSSSNPKVATVSNTGLITAKKKGTTVITATSYNGKTAKLTITVKYAPSSVTLKVARNKIGVGEVIATAYTLSSGAGGSISKYNITPATDPVIKIDENGLITAVRTGTATIACMTYNGKISKAVTITVVAAPTSITSAKSSVSIGVGASDTLLYTLSNSCTGGVTFTSADTSICTADANTGKITGVKAGKTTVTMETYNGIKCNVEVTVTPAPTSVSLESASISIGVGQTLKLSPCVLPEGAVSAFKYSSSKVKYVTVSADGVITGIKKGSSVVTVTTYNGQTAKLTVTVLKAPTAVAISTPYTKIGVGESEAITVAYPTGTTGSISKYTSSNTSVVTVDADGTFHGVGKGTATITATTYNNKKSNALTITVGSAPESIAFESETINICVDDSCTLGYTTLPNVVGDITFTSDNTSIATVNSKTGAVTGKAKGSCKITVTTYNGKTAVCTVVVQAAPTAVSITAEKTVIGIGEKLQINAICDPQDSAASVIYKTSNTKYATIDANGVLTGVKAGTVTVGVKTYNGLIATKKFTVVNAPTAIAFTQAKFVIGQTEAIDLMPYLKATTGTSCSYTFKSSNKSICSIDSVTGEIIGQSVGSATITATSHNGKTATCVVYVAYAPTSVTLGLSEDLTVGEKYELTSTLGPNETKYASYYRNYTVVSGTCVTINASGMLEAIADGTAKIRVETYLPAVYDEITVSVHKAPTFITFASTSYEVDIEDTLQLSPIIDDNTITTFTYAITKAGYFTISETGLVQPVSRGSTTVTVTTKNGLSTKITISIVDSNFPESIEWTNVDDNPPNYMSTDNTSSYPSTWVPEVTVTPSSATPQMAWSSSDASVLEYDTTSGAFKAVSYGTATVTGRSERNPSLVLTVKITVVNSASESHCLTVPTQFTSISGKSSSAISSIISNNEAIMASIKSSAFADLDTLKSAGTITSGEASSRKTIINRAFAMLDFPWTTPDQVAYWTSSYDSSSYYTWISGTKYVGHSKDYREDVLYFGLPYTQTYRNFNQSNIVSGGWYSSKSNGKYTLNTSKFSGRNYRGNDCSSFVSQSEWGSGNYDNTTAIAKSSKYTTLDKSTYATKMRPGDILVRSGHHVVMFLYYTNAAKTQFMIIEQGGSDDYNTNVVACRIRNASSYSSYTIRRPIL